jgi:hypothetical protein
MSQPETLDFGDRHDVVSSLYCVQREVVLRGKAQGMRSLRGEYPSSGTKAGALEIASGGE